MSKKKLTPEEEKENKAGEVVAGKLGQLSEDQKAHARSALVSAGVIAPRLKKVRIPKAFEDISLKWVKQAPFFSEFMLRFHYFKTADIPTAGVNCIRGNLNFYFNPEFIDGGGMRPKIASDGHPELILGKDGQPLLDATGNIQHVMEPRPALTELEVEGLLVHEIMHIIRLHHERSLADHQLFNIAADMLINNDISTMKIHGRSLALPEGGMYLKMATEPVQRPGMPVIEPYKGEEVSEPLYIWLMDVRQQFQDSMEKLLQQQKGGGGGQGQGQPCPDCDGTGKKQPGDGEGEKEEGDGQSGEGQGQGQEQGEGQASGSGGGDETCPTCGGSGQQPGGGPGDQSTSADLFDALYGSSIDVHEVQQQSDELSEATIKEVIDSAKMRGWGKISGDAIQKMEDLLKPAKLPWRQILRKCLSPMVYDYGPHFENTWSRRNRRSLPLPGMRRLSNKIVVAIDTSGSIGTDELGQFFAEIEKICKDMSQLVVMQWDTSVKAVEYKYRKGSWRKIEVKGRGGTSVQCVFDWMKENNYHKYPLVNFTDGWFDYGFNNWGVKTIWCVTEADSKVPHGRNIFIDTSH